jgi:exosortase A-associated hydrolase 1
MRPPEIPLVVPCRGAQMVGIVHPAAAPNPLGVLIVVGGPQYRVGSHRQFVLLARRLAKAGIPAMRFDYRGMGDSEGDFVGFEGIGEDIRAALDAFSETVPGIRQIVLWGLCDAASAILFYAKDDPRIAGIALLNPWVRTEAGHAKAQLRHYYLERLTSASFWSKLASGRVDLGDAAGSLTGAVRRAVGGSTGASATTDLAEAEPPLPERMARGLAGFGGDALVILSGNDLTAREFEDAAAASPTWRRLLTEERVTRRDLDAADHTFSRDAWRETVADWTIEWLRTIKIVR